MINLGTACVLYSIDMRKADHMTDIFEDLQANNITKVQGIFQIFGA